MNQDQIESLDTLLDFLKHQRGIDFTGYKRTSLNRRIRKRMKEVGAESVDEYINHLEVHSEEFSSLFNTILINVTHFFRDPEAWDYIRENVLPVMIEEKDAYEPIRVWCAGVSSGEEAYSIAIALLELIGEEAYRERVKIYATDLDEEELNTARQGSYSARQVAELPADLLERYFDQNGSHYTFRTDLRRSIIYGRHDLINDAPISRIDLLICRNTLMYFNAEIQAKILARFHFALNPDGFLFLGKAEMLLTHTGTFTPVDLRWRVFKKVPRVNLRDQLLLMAQGVNQSSADSYVGLARIRDLAFETGPVPQIVVDVKGFLALANLQASRILHLSPQDLGRPFRDLEISYRPAELRSAIDEAVKSRDTVEIRDVEFGSYAGVPRVFNVLLEPLIFNDDAMIGVSISFHDVTNYRDLKARLERANHELETAMEELQSTNEELETTNEELQSTIEEMETTNEELQSTNEELETMNEELQSTNEELETMNEELRNRTDELNQVNAFIESILISLHGAVVVLDTGMRVSVWSAAAEDLWGLRAEEASGIQFTTLDIGLPVKQLRQPLQACLKGDSEYELHLLEAHNRLGHEFECRVACTPLKDPQGAINGAIVIMEKSDGAVYPEDGRERA